MNLQKGVICDSSEGIANDAFFVFNNHIGRAHSLMAKRCVHIAESPGPIPGAPT